MFFQKQWLYQLKPYHIKTLSLFLLLIAQSNYIMFHLIIVSLINVVGRLQLKISDSCAVPKLQSLFDPFLYKSGMEKDDNVKVFE